MLRMDFNGYFMHLVSPSGGAGQGRSHRLVATASAPSLVPRPRSQRTPLGPPPSSDGRSRGGSTTGAGSDAGAGFGTSEISAVLSQGSSSTTRTRTRKPPRSGTAGVPRRQHRRAASSAASFGAGAGAGGVAGGDLGVMAAGAGSRSVQRGAALSVATPSSGSVELGGSAVASSHTSPKRGPAKQPSFADLFSP